jgi:hypothetical protein
MNKLYSSYIYGISNIIKNDIIKLLDDPESAVSYTIIETINKYGLPPNALVNKPSDYFGLGYYKASQILSITQTVKNILKFIEYKDPKEIRVGITVDDDIEKLLLYELSKIGLKLGDIQDSEYIVTDIFDLDIYDFVYEYDIEFGGYYRIKDLNKAKKYSDDDLLGASVDILILQNKGLRITIDNVEKIKAKYIIEAEENLITSEAERWLEINDITVIPDFISLGGILINSYIEWSSYTNTPFIRYNDYKDKIDFIISKCLSKIWKIKNRYELTTRDSALLLGITRLVNSIERRIF